MTFEYKVTWPEGPVIDAVKVVVQRPPGKAYFGVWIMGYRNGDRMTTHYLDEGQWHPHASHLAAPPAFTIPTRSWPLFAAALGLDVNEGEWDSDPEPSWKELMEFRERLKPPPDLIPQGWHRANT